MAHDSTNCLNRKILLVDDDDLIRRLIVHWLARRGHDVQEAENGTEATRMLAAGGYDLLITDLAMPDCNGLELIARARRIRPCARIIAISGGGKYLQAFPGADLTAEMGVDAVVIKPFTCQQLGDTIESVMSAPRKAIAEAG